MKDTGKLYEPEITNECVEVDPTLFRTYYCADLGKEKYLYLESGSGLIVDMCYVIQEDGEVAECVNLFENYFAQSAEASVENKNEKVLVRDLIGAGDIVVLVTPIDEAAPKGRLILPQQLVIRDILDAHGVAVTCQDTEIVMTLASLSKKPKMVITDSQVFEKVSKDVPKDVPLTSFSILMAASATCRRHRW